MSNNIVIEVKHASELFDAGYAVPQYNISTNKTVWRFRGESFETPRFLCDQFANVNGTTVAVCPMTTLEKHRAGKAN